MSISRLGYTFVGEKGGEILLLEHGKGFLVTIKKESYKTLEKIGQKHGKDIILTSDKEMKLVQSISDLYALILNRHFIVDDKPIENYSQIRLHITDRCNLSCKYCFVKSTGSTIALETAYSAIELLRKNNGNRQGKILFFGGEPLLEFDLLKKIVSFGKKKFGVNDISFSVTTNGTLLNDEIIGYFAKNSIGVLLSYDGKMHDSFRPAIDGSHTSNSVRRSIDELLKILGVGQVAVAATITHENNDILSIVKEIVSTGVKRIRLNFELTGHPTFSLSKEDFNKIASQVPDIIEFMDKNRSIELSYFGMRLNRDGSFSKTFNCPACHHELTVNLDGNIYPCSLFVGDKNFCLGNVNSGILKGRKKYIELKYSLDRNFNNCSKCSNKYLCGGHCPYDSFRMTGDIDGRNAHRCNLYKIISDNQLRYYIKVCIERSDINYNRFNYLAGRTNI